MARRRSPRMWSRRCSNWGALLAATLLGAACSTTHVASTAATPAPAPPPSAPASAAPTEVTSTGVAGVAAASAVPAAPPPPPRALADFARAVQLVKSGKDDEAELQFQQIATG